MSDQGTCHICGKAETKPVTQYVLNRHTYSNERRDEFLSRVADLCSEYGYWLEDDGYECSGILNAKPLRRWVPKISFIIGSDGTIEAGLYTSDSIVQRWRPSVLPYIFPEPAIVMPDEETIKSRRLAIAEVARRRNMMAGGGPLRVKKFGFMSRRIGVDENGDGDQTD